MISGIGNMYKVMPSSIDTGLIQALIAVIIFAAGMIVSWLVWLTLRHYDTAKPVYNRVMGDEATKQDGHISESRERFDELRENHSALADRVDRVHDDVRKVEHRQDTVLSNQKKIADGLGVDLDRPRFYRGGRQGGSVGEGDATGGD